MQHAFEFDQDTQLTRVGEAGFSGQLSERWNIGAVPNGGYVMAVACRAFEALLPHPDVLTLSGHYIAPTAPGPVELAGTVLHSGRSTSCANLLLKQDGRTRATFTATAGHFDDPAANLADHSEVGPPPELPPAAECTPAAVVPGLTPEIVARFDARHAPATLGWHRGEPGGPLLSAAHIAFADGRPPDVTSLPLFADAVQPTIFSRYGVTGWVPTLQLNLQMRRRPAAGPLAVAFRTRHVTGGLHEEDGELWDADGRLVALSRQLARVRMPAQG